MTTTTATETDRQQWLRSLKEGDIIALEWSGYRQPVAVHGTKGGLLTLYPDFGHVLFDIEEGRDIAYEYDVKLYPATEAEVTEAKHRWRAEWLSSAVTPTLTADQLDRIEAVVRETA